MLVRSLVGLRAPPRLAGHHLRKATFRPTQIWNDRMRNPSTQLLASGGCRAVVGSEQNPIPVADKIAYKIKTPTHHVGLSVLFSLVELNGLEPSTS